MSINPAEALGRRRWAVAEGSIPGRSNGPPPEFEGHASACILNAAQHALLSTIAFAGEE